nr:IS630 family transposase [Paenibacillus sp. HW567]
MYKKYKIELSLKEREQINQCIHDKKTSKGIRNRCLILLLADESQGQIPKQIEIAQRVGVSDVTVYHTIKDYCTYGLESTLHYRQRPNPGRPAAITGEEEARIIALACSEPPNGYARWTIRLLTSRVIELGILESVGRETIRQTLKKPKLKPHLKKQWCIPAKANAEFVARMEDVLETYALPYDFEIPLICMDEQPVQLLDHTRPPEKMKPGKVRREDYEYERKGSCTLFLFTEPLAGWRHVCASQRRTKSDWAEQIRELLEVHYPKAKRIRLVMDNLNTHTLSSLYETFSPDVALSLAKRLEIHYTPKHGSWLNIAEIELSAMTIQCLHRRISSIEQLQQEVTAWKVKRNQDQKSVQWQFTTEEARGKLKHLYPKI